MVFRLQVRDNIGFSSAVDDMERIRNAAEAGVNAMKNVYYSPS